MNRKNTFSDYYFVAAVKVIPASTLTYNSKGKKEKLLERLTKYQLLVRKNLEKKDFIAGILYG